MKSRLSQFGWFVPHVIIGLGIPGFGDAWGAMFGFHIALAVMILVRRQRLSVLVEGWDTPTAVRLVAMTAPVGVAIYLFFAYLPFELDAVRLGVWGVLGDRWIWFCLYFCAVNPALEELFWRGGIEEASPERQVPRLSLGDFCFGTYHLIVLIYLLPPAIAVSVTMILCVIGYIWRLTANKCGGLAPSVVSHTVANVSAVLGVTAVLS